MCLSVDCRPPSRYTLPVRPVVSCVMLTTHPKRARYLPDALRSYRGQTLAERELVVVNDGAPLLSRAPDITVVNLPDRGRRWTIGEKRNVGVRFARGEFVATWDDDDVSLPGRLAAQVSLARTRGADYVLADRMLIATPDMTLIGRCDRGRPVQASALIRRDAVVAAGGYRPLDYMEDRSLLERIRYLALGTIWEVPESDWYVMRRHGDNVTNTHGESDCEYGVCALRDPNVSPQQRELDALRRGPGAEDIYEPQN